MSNIVKKLVELFLDTFAMRSESFKNYIRVRYWQCCESGDLYPLTGAYIYRNGIFYIPCKYISVVRDVENEYEFEDIRKDDIVLDIGANIGAFTLLASQRAKHVYAVEPLFSDFLKKHIEINNIKNVTVLELGLGGRDTQINFEGRTKTVSCNSLTDIIKMCGGHVDFLKIDCEGAEWGIRPEELAEIRRIEAEVHVNGRNNMQSWMNMLTSAGFSCKVRGIHKLPIVHASFSYQ